MKTQRSKVFLSLLSLATALTMVSCGSVNTNNDPRFDEDGYFLRGEDYRTFSMENPSRVKFYVEVSGSMNGYFRANQSTQFKNDLWDVINYYSPIAQDICILTNSGSTGSSFSQADFRTKMNTGAFVSTASTKVPEMIQTIMNNLDTTNNEVAILVSDMKYSPVGSAAPSVLLGQYRTDIGKILGSYGAAVCLIGATSDFLDKNGNPICNNSPYYYFVIGKAEHVAMVRNQVSTLLENNGHLIDNIESGFDFGHPKYSFGICNKCEQLDDEPSFVAYEEADSNDTCTIRLKVNLENYRWIICNDEVFRESFKANTIYGSELRVANITYDVKNITGSTKDLKRSAIATVDLKLYNMALESEVIQWTLDLPDLNIALFNEYFQNAYDELDPSKSFSVEDFVRGMFYVSVVNKDLEPNYILVSKNY